MEKCHGGLKLLLPLLFFMVFVSFSNTCKAVTLDDYQLTDDIMNDIVIRVKLNDFYSGDYIPLLTNQFNTMMRTIRARGDGHLVTLSDCVFYGGVGNNTSQQVLQVSFMNWRDLDEDQRAFYETNYQPYINLNSANQGITITGSITIQNWMSWTYDSNNSITGVNATAYPHWTLTQNNFTYVTTNVQVGQVTYDKIHSGDFAINKIVILDQNRFDGEDYVLFASRTTNWGYGFYIYSNVIYLDNYSTITPTPTPTGSGGGGTVGGSTDLTNTNNKIDEVKNTIISTIGGVEENESGDIVGFTGLVGSLFKLIKSVFIPSDDFLQNYWNDLSGFFQSKLGFLWDVVLFVPNFFQNIIDACNAIDPNGSIVFEIPELSTPDFQGGEVIILESFTWDFTSFLNDNANISELYYLYLNLIDFLVAIALISYALDTIASIFEIKSQDNFDGREQGITFNR